MSAWRSVVVLLSALSTAGAGEPLGAADVAPAAAGRTRIAPLTVRLVWIDGTGVAEGCGPAAREETAQILASVGLTVRWRVGATASERAADGEIRVILVESVTRIEGTAILASTSPKFEGATCLWIHVPSIRAALGVADHGAIFDLLDFRDQSRTSRAVGRVIAHEVVHAVAPGVPHGLGLMAPSFGRRDFMASKVRIEPQVAEAVRAALAAGHPISPVSDTAILASE